MATLETEQFVSIVRLKLEKYARNGVFHICKANRTSQDIPQQGYNLLNYVKRFEGACSTQQVKAYRDNGVSFFRHYRQLFR